MTRIQYVLAKPVLCLLYFISWMSSLYLVMTAPSSLSNILQRIHLTLHLIQPTPLSSYIPACCRMPRILRIVFLVLKAVFIFAGFKSFVMLLRLYGNMWPGPISYCQEYPGPLLGCVFALGSEDLLLFVDYESDYLVRCVLLILVLVH